MLVLTRKIQESVVVGGSIGFEQMLRVTVLEIVGGKVRLGFEIDASVPVHRAEVWDRIQTGAPPAARIMPKGDLRGNLEARPTQAP